MKTDQEIQKCYIGIDVSKLTLDVSIIQMDGSGSHEQFENGKEGFVKMNEWLNANEYFDYTTALFCMEHTGLYTRQLVGYLLERSSRIWMESALHLKRSMGITRGKTDKVDSYRIARYAMTHQDKMRLVSIGTTTLGKMKDLMASRDRVNKCYQSITISIREMERIDKSMGKELRKLNSRSINGLLASKKKIEDRIMELIVQDENIKALYDLVTSVKGVGQVLATELLVYTNGFTRLTNARQLACYCGVAPFEHSSGTSIRGRTGTSNFANMNLKSTLHMAAVSSMRYVPELKKYYERKVAEGKHKMTVINAIRNKLIQRILAVIKRGTPYEEIYLKNNLQFS